MGLLAPLALLTLAAIIVPLAIHIARRSEIQTIDFAALRWLRQKPKPRSRLRFDEWPLLLIRMALIALIALLLARPVWMMGQSNAPYVAVVPGAAVSGIANDAHWIAPGFPRIDAAQPQGPLPVASLIRELDAQLPVRAALTLIVPERLAGADGAPLRLSRKVDWRITGGTAKPDMVAKAKVAPVAIRADEAHRGALRYLRGAAAAWQVKADVGDVEAPLPDHEHRLIWMRGGTMPDALSRWVTDGGTALLASDMIVAHAAWIPLWQDGDGAPLVEGMKQGKGRLLRFTRPMTAAAMPVLLEADFPGRLRAVLDAPAPAPTQVMASDYAPMMGGRAGERAPTDLRPWIALIIAGLFLVERWMATQRRRSVAP